MFLALFDSMASGAELADFRWEELRREILSLKSFVEGCLNDRRLWCYIQRDNHYEA